MRQRIQQLVGKPVNNPPAFFPQLRAGWVLFAVAALTLAWVYFHKAPESRSAFRLSILPPANTTVQSFAISPDGKTVAFTALWKGGPMLWVRALDSVDAKPLAGTEDASQPFWSPDSRSIGFFTNSKLKTIGVAGGPARDIADVVVGRGASWGLDGTIVFGPKPGGVLFQVPANGGTPRAVTSLDQYGRRFVYLASSVKPGMSAIRSEIAISDDRPAIANRTGPAMQWIKHRVATITPARSPEARDIGLVIFSQKTNPNRQTSIRGWSQCVPLDVDRKL